MCIHRLRIVDVPTNTTACGMRFRMAANWRPRRSDLRADKRLANRRGREWAVLAMTTGAVRRTE